MAIILDGKKIAEQIKNKLKVDILELKKRGIIPGLAVILVGNDLASEIYVRNKEAVSQELGIYSESYKLDKSVSEKKLLELIAKLNRNKKIHGILVQLPLPQNIDENKIIEAISPEKDVDCFHPKNVGKLALGKGMFYPCAPGGILEILKKYKITVEGKDVTIIGASNIVGKPLALMLLNLNATVTVCHDKTKNLKEKCLQADILISATGKAGLVSADMVKQGAVVIDVGMNRNLKGNLRGDIDFEKVKQIASALTPVPGGVGPVTVAKLMENTIKATKSLNKI